MKTWDKVTKNLAAFSSAVLTGRDAGGYPFSVRCTVEPDPVHKTLRILNPGPNPIQPGPAGLLCHTHNKQLWGLKSFLVRGTLEQDPAGWVFRPLKFIPGMGFGNQIRLIVQSRARAKKYLEHRGLPRPKIQWNEFQALWKKARGS